MYVGVDTDVSAFVRAFYVLVYSCIHVSVRAFEGIYTCEFLFLNSSERLCARLFMCACECGYTCVSVCSCARVNIPTYASVRARVCVTLCSCESDHC